jgi:hypothetical protein
MVMVAVIQSVAGVRLCLLPKTRPAPPPRQLPVRRLPSAPLPELVAKRPKRRRMGG